MKSQHARDRLRELIELSGLESLSRVDELAGITRGHTRHILTGYVEKPSEGTCTAYATLFGHTAAYLMFGIGRRPDEKRVKAAVDKAARRKQEDNGQRKRR